MNPGANKDYLRVIAQSISTASGDEFFPALATSLCQALAVDFAFVGRLDADQLEVIQVMGVCVRGKIAENFSYRLHGTPCKNVVGSEPCHYPHNVQDLFPEDRWLVEMGIESYIGYPLFGSAGQALGLLAVMHSQPLPEVEPARSILQLCASRAAAELERHRSEQALRQSEEHYQVLARLAPVGIFRTDAEGHCTYVNQQWCDIAGINPEQAYGDGWVRAIHPDDRKYIFERWYTAAKNNLLFQEECRMQRPDGVTTWVLAQASAEHGPDDRVTGYVGSITNITERRRSEKVLRENNEILERIFDSTHFCLVYLDRDFNFIRVNRAYANACGFPPEHFPGKNHFHLYPHEENEAIFRHVVQTGEPFTIAAKPFEFPDHPEWGVTYWDWTLHPLKDAAGNVEALLFVLLDVTERKKAEIALRDSERSLAHAQRIAHLGNWDWNIVTNDLHWSDEIYRIFGLKPREFGATYDAFLSSVHPDDRQSVIDAVNKALYAAEPYSIDHRIVLPDGTEHIVHEQAEVTFDKNGKPIRMVGTVQDITLSRRAQERLNYLAYYDTLTGLPNRVLLQDRLHQAMLEADRRDRLVAVLFLDLDRFKIINDTLGHDVGDALLKEVAGRLTACLRAGDAISRLGGDEFTVILANVAHVDDVSRVAQKIIDSFMPPFQIAGREMFISASIGITLYPLDDSSLENLMRNADAAMYHAKELGRNTFQFYTAELNRRTAKRLALETALRHALERNELLLHYQPQVSLKTGKIIGAEALLRWRHPEMGLIPPLDFIPLAEETGLIIPIGEWVLQTACRQARDWHRAGFSRFQVAVNLSGRQLQHRNLAKLVKKVLKETGLDPRYLDLELTESLLMHNTGETLSVMDELHALGVAFSMDDFGTGYSSLSYLKRFPIDTLKIDQSFVRDIPTDPDDSAIAQAIIAMARSLEIRVIAEGVETAKQLAFMRMHHCNGMQGYYFSKPVPAEAITALLQKDHRLALRQPAQGKKRARRKTVRKK